MLLSSHCWGVVCHCCYCLMQSNCCWHWPHIAVIVNVLFAGWLLAFRFIPVELTVVAIAVTAHCTATAAAAVTLLLPTVLWCDCECPVVVVAGAIIVTTLATAMCDLLSAVVSPLSKINKGWIGWSIYFPCLVKCIHLVSLFHQLFAKVLSKIFHFNWAQKSPASNTPGYGPYDNTRDSIDLEAPHSLMHTQERMIDFVAQWIQCQSSKCGMGKVLLQCLSKHSMINSTAKKVISQCIAYSEIFKNRNGRRQHVKHVNTGNASNNQ